MHTADLVRINEYRKAPPVMGWLMIVLVTVAGFSTLAYAIGKWQGMGVCR